MSWKTGSIFPSGNSPVLGGLGVRESSWLVFSLPFPPVCFISGKELTGLKGWIQVEEKVSFFEGLGEYSCFH